MVDEEDADDNTSVNSYSGLVGPRWPIFPDFAICRYTGTLTGDTLHIVVEVKSKERSINQCNIQLGQYLESQGAVGRDAIGMSIAGRIVQVFFMTGPHC